MRIHGDTRRYTATHGYEALMVALDTLVDGRAEGRMAQQSLFLCCTRAWPRRDHRYYCNGTPPLFLPLTIPPYVYRIFA